MEIVVRGKNMTVNSALKEYAERKLSKVEKFLKHEPLNCQVTFSTERDRYVVEATIPLNGYLLRAEEWAYDALSSVDKVVDKLERQIKKYRTRLFRRDRQGVLEEPVKEEELDEHTIVRVKRFPVKPMSPEEATLQMELLGHDFFMFRNGDTGIVNVIYRRKDGNYGLIEPDA